MNTPKESMFPDCPIRNIISRISDKWSMLIVLTLNEYNTLRFNQLQKEIPDISQKMLSATLKKLEADGLINRTVYAQIPPKVEYNLTDKGKRFIPCIKSLVDWVSEELKLEKIS